MKRTIPEELLQNPHFNRYYQTWQDNPVSIVFIPLAQICREYGFLAEAREICEAGLVHHPHSVSACLMLAKIFLDLEKFEEAKVVVEKILNDFPAQHEARKLLARISKTGGVDKNRQAPISLWDNVTMAGIYAQQGEKTIARQIIDKILAHRPQDSRALAFRKELLE